MFNWDIYQPLRYSFQGHHVGKWLLMLCARCFTPRTTASADAFGSHPSVCHPSEMPQMHGTKKYDWGDGGSQDVKNNHKKNKNTTLDSLDVHSRIPLLDVLQIAWRRTRIAFFITAFLRAAGGGVQLALWSVGSAVLEVFLCMCPAMRLGPGEWRQVPGMTWHDYMMNRWRFPNIGVPL